VQHDGKYANLDSVDEVFTVGINRAVAALAEKKSRPRAGASANARGLGEHPQLGGPVTAREGRFGPYVHHGKVNATLPKGMAPQTVTLEQAVELLAARAAKPAKPARAGKKR
jgi:DNA topoisomerase-1